jgi:hypothetical protein
MSKFARCDNCGEEDDWTLDGIPILDGGAVLMLRSDESGSDEFEYKLEICPACKRKLIEALPGLKTAMSQTCK